MVFKKFQLGKNFYVVYSPEREDPTMKNFSVGNIPKLVSGVQKLPKIRKLLVPTNY